MALQWHCCSHSFQIPLIAIIQNNDDAAFVVLLSQCISHTNDIYNGSCLSLRNGWYVEMGGIVKWRDDG